LPFKELVEIVEVNIAFLICNADAEGFDDTYNATAPVTCGVAIEVPL